MIPEITIGATSIFGTLIVATAASRWAVTPPREPGRHRSPMLRPVEALDQFEAHCPIEDRPTLQIRLRLGGELCMECHNHSDHTKEGAS